jgi:hypothetical protein
VDRPWDEPDGARDAPSPATAAVGADHGTILTDTRTRQQYAATYRAAVDAANQDAEHRAGSEKSDDAALEKPDAGQEKTADRPDSIHDVPDMADRYPDDYKPWSGSRGSVDRAEVLEEWLKGVNPDKPAAGRWNNCGECARAVAKTWFGDVVTAAALADDEAAGEATNRMSEWAGEKPRPASMTEVGRRLRDLGDGSLAVVGFDLHGGGGHWFNAVNYEGTALAVDGQSGRHEKWPPSIAGLGFDGSKMSYSEAIFFTPEGKVVRDDH